MATRRRRRRRSAREQRSGTVTPGGTATRAFQPLSQDGIERIHEASLTILERTGIEVVHSEAREILRQAGAEVDEDRDRVFLPRTMVEEALAQAASEVLLAGQDAKHDLQLGGDRVYMGTGGAAVKVLDLDGYVRESRLEDIAQIARLVDALDNIHFYLRPVVAQDVPREILDVNKTYAALANTSKHVMTQAYSVESAHDVIELATMVAGGRGAYEDRPLLSFVASWTVSPLRFAPETVEVLIELVRANVPVALSSAPQAGATSPAALAGTMAQVNAEELSGLVICNLVRPGARVLMGYVPSVADLRTGNFVGGSPEFALMHAAAAQLAHFYGVPIYNSSALSDSKIPDIQAGYEKGMTSTAVALSGSNFIHHSAGMLESLLAVAYEQYVIDDDINGAVMRMVRGIEVNDETLSLDLIDQVCRGEGHFLGTQQSLHLMNSEYHYPHTGDRSRREEWEEQGYRDMRERARERAREILASHWPSHLSPDVHRAIRERFDIVLPADLSGPYNTEEES